MNTFESNNISLYGENGREWLATLADITTAVAKQHELTQLQPIANLSYNYVVTGYQHNKPIILKLSLDYLGLRKEAQALNTFNGHGAGQVLAEGKGYLITERAIPGTSLNTYFPNNDDQSIVILCRVIARLHQAPIANNHHFPTLRDWLAVFEQPLAIPERYLNKARMLRDKLLNTSTKTVLLHGDLHHDNLLQHDNDWMVIDPKGVVGDPVYEVCAFIRNPIPDLLAVEDPNAIINNRISQCAAMLGYAEQRIRDWFYVDSILSWAWQLQDGLDSSYCQSLIETWE